LSPDDADDADDDAAEENGDWTVSINTIYNKYAANDYAVGGICKR
jgi:hypothetical protein